jgi:CubicO group peptidase (beta-lactamase class C family)
MRGIFAQPELAALFVKPGSSAEQFEAAARRSPADFAPGERWSYSNMNYVMLTFIAERATGHVSRVR